MSDDKQMPISGQSEETRRFFEKYNALRAEGKSQKEALDSLDEEFFAMLRKVLPPEKEVVSVINPEAYESLVDVAKAFTAMGFDEDEVSMKLNGRHYIGSVIVSSDDLVFNRDCLLLLSDILDTVGSVNMRSTSDGRVRMAFTIPNVLKPL